MSRLPVSHRDIEFRRVDYSERNWNQTPRISTIREIERISDDIARLAANEVTEQADRNAVRTVHFNILAENEFRNREFEDLVQFIADFIELRMFDNRIRDAYQELEATVETAVVLHAASFIDKYRELDDIVQDHRDNNFVRTWDEYVGKYGAVIRDIGDMHSNDQRDLRRGGNSRAYEGSSRTSDRHSRGSSERSYAAPRGEERSHRSSRETSGRNDRYASERQYSQPRNNIRPDFDPSDFEETPDTQTSAKQTHFTETQDSEAQEVIKAHKLSNRMMEDGAVFIGINGSIPLLIDPNGESEMDKFKHASIYGNGIPDAPDMSKEIIRVFTLAQAVNDGGVKTESIEKHIVVDNEPKIFSNTASMCESISNEAVMASMDAVEGDIEGKRQIHHGVAVVDNRFIGHKHLADFHDSLKDCRSITDMMTFFKHCISAVNENASAEAAYASDIRAAVSHYDRIITRELNDYCVSVLQIKPGDPTKPLFTSALNDLHTLLNHLDNTNQDKLRNALSGFMSILIDNISEGFDKTSGVSDNLNSVLKSYEENGRNPDNYRFSFLPITYVTTHLPFTLKELGYNITGPVAITNSDVSSFIRAALDVSGTAIENEPVVSKPLRLIITRDRQAFRLYKYPGTNNTIILTPYPIG